MYLYASLSQSTLYWASKSFYSNLVTAGVTAVAHQIPYCTRSITAVLLLICMIPLVNCEGDTTMKPGPAVTSRVSSVFPHNADTTAPASNPEHNTTARSYTSQENSCTNSSSSSSSDCCTPCSQYSRLNTSCTSFDSGQRLDTSLTEFKNLLKKYDCRSSAENGADYELHSYSQISNCGFCLEAYKEWLCSVNGIYTDEADGPIYPCTELICNKVKRSCPYIHPLDEGTMYSSEPGFLCNVGAEDRPPCYYFNSSATARDNVFLKGRNVTCEKGSTLCILHASSSGHRAVATINTLILALLILLCNCNS